MKVWKEVANEEAFVKVFDRLKRKYAIIKKSGDGNDYCEDFCGKKGAEDIATWECVEANMEEGGEEEEEEGGDELSGKQQCSWLKLGGLFSIFQNNNQYRYKLTF
eukprot:8956646-Ditylum_brightwellii.AAC.1